MPQDNLAFLVDQAALIETTIYERRYPSIQYPELVPVDTSAPEWINMITHFSSDQVGEAAWFSERATVLPLADVTRDKEDVTVEMAAIGYDYNEAELNTARMLNINLNDAKARSARRAYEQFMDDIALRGDTDKGWNGLINQTTGTSGVTQSTAPVGAGGDEEWAEKTQIEIIADVNAIIQGIYEETKQTEMADTVLLPLSAAHILNTVPFGDNTPIALMRYLMENNPYTNMTGQALTIRTVRGLEDAGAGSSGRMIAYRRDPDVLRLHLPMPHRFGEPMKVSPYTYVVPGAFRTGGLEVRLPKAIRYMDMITT